MTNRTLLITSKHSFVSPKSPGDIERRRHQLDLVKRLRDQMSPAGERLVDAFIEALELRYHDGKGLSGYEHVNRESIATQLKHTSLYPHDIRLLRMLGKQRFIREAKRNLPTRWMIGIDGQKLQLGAGFEYVYTMHEETLYCLLWHNPNYRLKLEQLEQAEKLEAAHRERRRQAKEFRERQAFLESLKGERSQQRGSPAQPRTPPASKPGLKLSLWDRLTGRKP